MSEVIGARRVSTLLAFPGFARLGPVDAVALSALAEERLVPRGTALVRPGRVEQACFIVDGALRVTARGQTRLAGAREAVGVLELLAEDPDGLEAIAESDVRALSISRDAFMDFLADSFTAAQETLRALARRVVELARTGPIFTWPSSPAPRMARPTGPLGYADKLLCVHGALRHAPRKLAATAELARITVERRYQPGELLWRAGDSSDSGAIVVSGEIECTPDGGAASFRFGPGVPVGGLEALARVPRWYHAVAASELVTLELLRDDMMDIFEDHMDLTVDLMKSMATLLLRFERLA